MATERNFLALFNSKFNVHVLEFYNFFLNKSNKLSVIIPFVYNEQVPLPTYFATIRRSYRSPSFRKCVNTEKILQSNSETKKFYVACVQQNVTLFEVVRCQILCVCNIFNKMKILHEIRFSIGPEDNTQKKLPKLCFPIGFMLIAWELPNGQVLNFYHIFLTSNSIYLV